jgi:anti-sigma regulatory factor (Ser/Thr protein kinase)
VAGRLVRLDLPAGPVAVRAAREQARAVLSGWGLVDVEWLDHVELVIAELVSNAVRHAGGGWLIELRVDPESVLITALDRSPSFAPPGGNEHGGRGLQIVAALSAAWGWRRCPGGKEVWARLAHPSPG